MRTYITEAWAQFVIGMKVFIVGSNKYYPGNIHWRSSNLTNPPLSQCMRNYRIMTRYWVESWSGQDQTLVQLSDKDWSGVARPFYCTKPIGRYKNLSPPPAPLVTVWPPQRCWLFFSSSFISLFSLEIFLPSGEVKGEAEFGAFWQVVEGGIIVYNISDGNWTPMEFELHDVSCNLHSIEILSYVISFLRSSIQTCSCISSMH